MMKETKVQIYANNNDEHQHVQDQPRSSGNPLEIGSSTLSSSSLSSSPLSGSSPRHTATSAVNAKHYSILFNNDVNGLRTQINDVFSLFTESEGSTLLHIAASVGEVNFIDTIMLLQTAHGLHAIPNSKGDLPLHAAARACQLEAVKRLVSNADELDRFSMLKAVNEDGNAALHIALQNHQQEMATFLFEKCPITCDRLNLQGFSPLYLAIKAQFWDLVTRMLSPHPTDPQVDGDGEANTEAVARLIEGKSVVHAAIVASKTDILEKMLNKYGLELMYKGRDEMGRTPLSYAAYIGFLDWVKYMIHDDGLRNQAYVIDENGFFPIHWACRGGNIEVVKEFFWSYPRNARWLLNNQGQNILHVAAANGKAKVVKYILQQPDLDTMINMKDKDGNTPFLLGCKEKHPRVVYLFTWDDRVKLAVQNNDGFTALDMAEDYVDIPSFEERLTWLFLRCAGVLRAPQLHYLKTGGINEANLNDTTSPTPLNVLLQRHLVEKTLKKHKNRYKERINTLLVVSILVATVTFTSGFTVPGGYKNNNPGEGMATLAHKGAFQVFVIANTIA